MKQGSADDPFADESTGDEPTETDSPADTQSGKGPQEESDPTPQTHHTTDDSEASNLTQSDAGSPTQQRSLPYIHSRDGVKDGRTQRPVFLRAHIEEGIDQLLDKMEAEIGEDVYKTDVTEAAMAVAQENPELVQAKLEEWGYGWQ